MLEASVVEDSSIDVSLGVSVSEVDIETSSVDKVLPTASRLVEAEVVEDSLETGWW